MDSTICCFSAKGVAPGGVLHELLSKAIVVLHFQGAIVKNLVCDCAQSNKTVMSLFGVSGGLSADFASDFSMDCYSSTHQSDQTQTKAHKIPNILSKLEENQSYNMWSVLDLRKPADNSIVDMINNFHWSHTTRPKV